MLLSGEQYRLRLFYRMDRDGRVRKWIPSERGLGLLDRADQTTRQT
jgi:hypothetical protein